MMVLDCSCYETAITSLANMFRTSEDALLSCLRSLDPYGGHKPPQVIIYNGVFREFGDPLEGGCTLWFHGSRVPDLDAFREHGILPKTLARKVVEPILTDLSFGLESFGAYPHEVALSGKQGSHDEGPFAFLILDALKYAQGATHNYLQCPEIVEDIAGERLGSNYLDLVHRYQLATKPCVVSFYAETKEYELQHALWYVKLIDEGETGVDAASMANTFFDAKGQAVIPDDIVRVDSI